MLTSNQTQSVAGVRTRVCAALGLVVWFLGACAGWCGDPPVMTEAQVKALCLINFAKYVEWPAGVFAETNSPIIIGILGDGRVADELEKAVKGKSIGGREPQVTRLRSGDDLGKCHMLFAGSQEKDRFAEILRSVKDRPVLTVGDAEVFRRQGGIMSFVMKEGKVRFLVNLEGARQAQLQISSRLLSLADDVSGKQ